jgi:CDP-6-deoxy-D-xylo-4-hexulose-3-dehydrase
MENGIGEMKTSILYDVNEYAKQILSPKEFIPGVTYIPASTSKLYSEDIATLTDAVLSCWFTEWKYAEKFKKELSNVTNSHFVTLCNSGSSANLLAIKSALETFKRGGKYVVTCASGFPTTVAPIYQCGKVPVYVDIDPFTLQPKMEDVFAAIREYSSAGVILTHNLGFPYDEYSVLSMVRDGQFFISDCCDCLGGSFSTYKVGTFSDASTHSFFPAHMITTGEGGAVTTRNETLHLQAEKNSNWGRSCSCKPGQNNTCGHRFDWQERGDLPEGWDHKYIFDTLGYNLKMTDLQAALGYAQIQHLPEFIKRRRKLFWDFSAYCLGLGYIDTVDVPIESNPVPFGIPIIVKGGAPFTARDLIEYLEKAHIGTRRFFGGNIIRQPGFKNLEYEIVSNLNGSDFVMNNCFWIGCHPSITDEMFDYMLSIIDDFTMEMR